MAGTPGTKHATFPQKLKAYHIMNKKLTQPLEAQGDLRWRYPTGESDETVAKEVGISASAVAAVRHEYFTEGFITQMPPRVKPEKKNQFVMPHAGEPLPADTTWTEAFVATLQALHSAVLSMSTQLDRIEENQRTITGVMDMATAPSGSELLEEAIRR